MWCSYLLGWSAGEGILLSKKVVRLLVLMVKTLKRFILGGSDVNCNSLKWLHTSSDSSGMEGSGRVRVLLARTNRLKFSVCAISNFRV